MNEVSPKPSKRQVSVAFAMVALIPLAADSSWATEDRSADQRYRACMALARLEPADALGKAEQWSQEGGSEAANHCRSTSLFFLGRFTEAAETLEAISGAKLVPTTQAQILGQAARARLLANDSARAVELLDQALRLDGSDPELRIDRAEAHAARGDYEAAVADLTDVITGERESSLDALVLRATANRRRGELDAAAIDLETVLSQHPEHEEALLERGLLRRARGDEAGAKADFTAVVARAPGTPAAMVAQKHLDRSPLAPSTTGAKGG